jgi:hypothetical protein
MITIRHPGLPGMDAPLAELAACFESKSRLPDQDLVRLTAAARDAGSRWEAIAAVCGIWTYEDLADVVDQITGESGADLLFSATQYAVEQLTGSQRRYPPLTWVCLQCGQQVTDRAASGRPVHVEHGHAPGCARLGRDEAADNERRREQIPPAGTCTPCRPGTSRCTCLPGRCTACPAAGRRA